MIPPLGREFDFWSGQPHKRVVFVGFCFIILFLSEWRLFSLFTSFPFLIDLENFVTLVKPWEKKHYWESSILDVNGYLWACKVFTVNGRSGASLLGKQRNRSSSVWSSVHPFVFVPVVPLMIFLAAVAKSHLVRHIIQSLVVTSSTCIPYKIMCQSSSQGKEADISIVLPRLSLPRSGVPAGHSLRTGILRAGWPHTAGRQGERRGDTSYRCCETPGPPVLPLRKTKDVLGRRRTHALPRLRREGGRDCECLCVTTVVAVCKEFV